MKLNKSRIAFRLSLVAVALLLVCGMAAAQNDQVKGVINVTQVLEPEGLFRKKHLTNEKTKPTLYWPHWYRD